MTFELDWLGYFDYHGIEPTIEHVKAMKLGGTPGEDITEGYES